MYTNDAKLLVVILNLMGEAVSLILTVAAILAAVLSVYVVAKKQGRKDAVSAAVPFLNLKLFGELVGANPATWIFLSVGMAVLALAKVGLPVFMTVRVLSICIVVPILFSWTWRFMHKVTKHQAAATIVCLVGWLGFWQLVPAGMLVFTMLSNKNTDTLKK